MKFIRKRTERSDLGKITIDGFLKGLLMGNGDWSRSWRSVWVSGCFILEKGGTMLCYELIK